MIHNKGANLAPYPINRSNGNKNIISGANMYRLIWRGKNSLAQLEKIERNEKYRIDIGAYGSIAIEAPTKEECLELFREVTSTKRSLRIDEAIR